MLKSMKLNTFKREALLVTALLTDTIVPECNAQRKWMSCLKLQEVKTILIVVKQLLKDLVI